MSELLEAARRELQEMHAFFVEWFRGECAQEDALFAQRLSSHFAPSFQIVFPGGDTLAGQALFAGMRAGYGGSPDFAIEIRAIREVAQAGDLSIFTYEEWQRNATNSAPSNGRISTVVFRRDDAQPNGLTWLHVHETWLPQAQIEAEPFDF